jgi:hypothetical protein
MVVVSFSMFPFFYHDLFGFCAKNNGRFEEEWKTWTTECLSWKKKESS